MDKQQRQKFDRELAAPPPRPRNRVLATPARAGVPSGGGRSSGTADLMAAFGTGRR